jgi:hypothetical protein
MDYSKNQGIISHLKPVATSPAKPLFLYQQLAREELYSFALSIRRLGFLARSGYL